jgi:hypothetical protein
MNFKLNELLCDTKCEITLDDDVGSCQAMIMIFT